MFALVDVKNPENPFWSIGLTNDQIGEISWAEWVMNVLIDQYTLNLRIKAFNTEISPEEYSKVQEAIKSIEDFRLYMKQLPIKKQEYERKLALEDAEKKAREEAAKARWE